MESSLLPKEWAPYEGDYEKVAYDIRLKNGKEYKECWPNAGYFMATLDGVTISGNDVAEFRVNNRWVDLD